MAYQGSLLVASALVAVGAFLVQPSLENVWAVLGLAAVAGLAERGRVQLGENIEASISLIPTVFAAAVFGPTSAILVAGASFAGEFPLLLSSERREAVMRRGSPYLRWSTYTCVRVIAAGLTGLVAHVAWSRLGQGTPALLGTTAVAAVGAEVFDVALTTLTGVVRGASARDGLRTLGGVAAASLPVYTPLVGLLTLAYRDLSPWTLAFFFIPALAAQRLYALYQSQRELTIDLVAVNERLELANLSFASALVTTLDARDRYTAGHSAAVAVYARDIAERMGLDDQQQRLAHLCGLVHDIGKIGLPAGLLEKPGALTLDERREMQRHSEIGERILSKVETYAEIASVVRHHHERVDGQGYPDGICSNEIPLLARIIAVADAYNAMTSDRPYRDAMPTQVARLRLAQAVETQFDTAVVAAFEAILAGATDDYRRAKGEEFYLAVEREDSTPQALDFTPVLARAIAS
jgi:putative nucleotidyltransferase with HDIG domain